MYAEDRILDDFNPYASPRNIDHDVFDEEADGLKITVRKPEFYTRKEHRSLGTIENIIFAAFTTCIFGMFVAVIIFKLHRLVPEGLFTMAMIASPIILVALCGRIACPLVHSLLAKKLYLPLASQYRDRCPETAESFVVLVRYQPYFFHKFASEEEKDSFRERLMTDSFDLGYLFFEGENLRFEGDGTSFTLPQPALIERKPCKTINIHNGEKTVVIKLRKALKHPFHTIEFRLKGGTSFSSFNKTNQEFADKIGLWSKNSPATSDY